VTAQSTRITGSQYNWNYSNKYTFVTNSVYVPRDRSHSSPWVRLGISSPRKPIIIVQKTSDYYPL